ncbi:MAG: hypothetical protein ACYDGR_02920, partial [Candidatus Dormibacteria bacterium]
MTWAVILIVAGIALRAYIAVTTPPLFLPDEAGHLLYIHEIARHGFLPSQSLDGIWANNNGAEDFYHPPLYYLLVSPVYGLFWPHVTALYALRFVNIIFGVGLLVVVYRIIALLFPDRPGSAPNGLLFVACLPSVVLSAAGVKKDAHSYHVKT